MSNGLFTDYNIKIDLEADEVLVEAWDEDTPDDVFYASVSLDTFMSALESLSGELARW